MLLYQAELRLIQDNKGYEETLYCGEAIHPFASILVALQTGSFTLQEAFVALLLESSGEKAIPNYHLEDEINERYGEGEYTKVVDSFIKRAGFINSYKEGGEVVHTPAGFIFSRPVGEEK